MANWIVLSIIVIMGIIFFAFVLPTIMPHDTSTNPSKMSLQQFCAQWKLQSRQHIFQGIYQCYTTTKNGASVVDTACDVRQTNGQYEFVGDCPLVPAAPITKAPTGQIP